MNSISVRNTIPISAIEVFLRPTPAEAAIQHIHHELRLSDKFDYVLFTDVLEHLMDDPVPTFLKMRRVLKEGGQLLVTTPNVLYFPLVVYPLMGKNVFPIMEEYYQPPVRSRMREVYDRHNRLYTMQEVKRLLGMAGFSIKRARFCACAEPVLKYRDRLEYDYRWSWQGFFSTDCIKKCLYTAVTAVFPFWRSWIAVTALKKGGR